MRRSKHHSWSFTEKFSVPVEWIEDDDIAIGGKSLPDTLLPFVKAHITPDTEEVIVEAECTGHYDEGRTYGDPDDCYPPEGSDERVIETIEFPDGLHLRDGETEADHHYFNLLADHVQEYIDKEEIDTRSYPDYDY